MTATVALNGTNITYAESTTGWARTGTISAPVQETDLVKQGTYAVSTKASNKAGWLYYDYGSGLNFTTTYAGAHIYMWMNCTTVGGLDVIANNALSIRIGSSTTNWSEWVLAGSDDTSRYEGDWVRLVLDPRKPPSATGGSGLSLSSVQIFGIYISTTGSAKSENLIIDRIDIGWGLRVYGTSTDGWADVVAADMGTSTNRYGILQDEEGVYFAYGGLELGDDQSTNATTFTDTDRVIKWVSQEYYNANGDWVPMIGDDLMGLWFVGNATGTTTITDGIVVGSGDTARGRNATTFIGSDLHGTEVDLYDGSNAANDVNLYGTVFKRISKGISWGNDSDHVYYGGTVDQCGQFDPVGAPVIRNCVFSGTTDWYDATVHAAIADDGAVYTDETTAANNATTNDMTLTPATPQVNDAYYFGHSDQFDRIFLNVFSAGTGTITWEYYNGSTWGALSNVVDETISYSVTGTNRVIWDMPTDWATTTVNSQGPYYYVRGRVSSAGNQAKGTQVTTYGPPTGSALLWNSNINIKNCSFIANTDSYNDPHAIQHDTATSVTYDVLKFSGNDYDIHLTTASGTLTVGTTPGTDVSTYEAEGTSTVVINNSVTLNVHVSDSSGADLADAQCYIQKSTDNEYTSTATGNNQGDLDFVVQEALSSDTPSSGWVRVLTAEETEQLYRYASKSGSTFTLETKVGPFACTGGGTGTSLQDTGRDLTALDIVVGDTIRNETDGSWAIVLDIVDADNITTTELQGGTDDTWTSGDNYSVHILALTYDGSDNAYVPWMNEVTDSNGDASSVTNYVTSTAVVIKVRKYGYKTFKGAGTVTSSGYSTDIILATEPNVGLG